MIQELTTQTIIAGPMLSFIKGEGKRGPYYRVQFKNMAADGSHLQPLTVFLSDDYPHHGLSEGKFVAMPVSVSTSREGRLYIRSLNGQALQAFDYARLGELLQELQTEAITGQGTMTT